MDRPRVRLGIALLAALFVSTLVHFTDNFLRLEKYSPGGSGGVTKPLIVASWLVFTSLGVLGLVLLRRGERVRPSLCFLAYAVAGLISPLHYLTTTPAAYDVVQHVFILTDFFAGLAVALFALGRLSRGHSQA